MIDTHCHLTFPQFEGRVGAVLEDARAVGVHTAITIATSTADSLRTTLLAQQHPNLWASAGIHPLHSTDPCDWQELHQAGSHPKCVAWGELGLDHHYDKPERTVQRRVLDEQLGHITRWTAQGLSKPIIVHCRKSFDELIPVLASSGLPCDRFVFHCFTGDCADMRKVLDFGAHVSFTGVLTFPGAPEVRDAARMVPLDRIMVETDSPFLSPQPVRRVSPNEPKHVVHVASALAQLRGLDCMQMELQLDANARRFFGLPAGLP